MSKLTLKVKKIGFKNPNTKQQGFVARVVTNGTEEFSDICEMAGLNTTLSPIEIEAASKLMLQAAARQLKNGKIIDLGVLGKLYPSVSGKWVEKEDDLSLSDLTAHTNYRPSQEIREAIAAAQLGWATDKDNGETEPETDTPSTDNGGTQNPPSGDLEG